MNRRVAKIIVCDVEPRLLSTRTKNKFSFTVSQAKILNTPYSFWTIQIIRDIIRGYEQSHAYNTVFSAFGSKKFCVTASLGF